MTIRISTLTEIAREHVHRFGCKCKTLASKLQRFFLQKTREESKSLSEMISTLDALEKKPAIFVDGEIQDQHYAEILIAGDQLLQNTAVQTTAAQDAKEELIRRLIGLQYRAGLEKQRFSKSLFVALSEQAKTWKSEQFIYDNFELTDEETAQIEKIASYPHFAKFALENRSIFLQVMPWALRDRCPVDIFVEFPKLQQDLFDAELEMKIGHFGEPLVRIEMEMREDGSLQKVANFLIEGEWVNVLDRTHTVTLRGGWKLTFEEIFEVFRNKVREIGDLEISSKGIVNWNSHKLGWYNSKRGEHELLDLDQKNWWEGLPPLERLSSAQVKERYGVEVDGKNWVVGTHSTRGSLTLDFEQTHAFIELAMPVGNGVYQVYAFGKFGIHFPSNVLENLKLFCQTMPAVVATPDENLFYHHRQHRLFSVPLSPRKGLRFMLKLRQDIRRARHGNFVYQIESENCAKWALEMLEDVTGKLPNLFYVPLLDTDPQSFVSWIWGGIRRMPSWLQTYAITRLVHVPFGAWRGQWVVEAGEKSWKSLWYHEFWETGAVFLPAFLNHQLDTGALTLVKTWTHSWFKALGEKVEDVIQIIENQILNIVEEHTEEAKKSVQSRVALEEEKTAYVWGTA